MGTTKLTHFDWSERAIATLRKMHHEGASASEIARALGGTLSRNSVIGKCHRLGLRRTEQAKTATQQLTVANKASAPRKINGVRPAPNTAPRVGIAGNGATFEHAPPAPLPMLRDAPATGNPARIVDDHWTRLGCKWPIGTPPWHDASEQMFCNGPRAPGEPRYCCDHRRVALSPNQPKRKDNPPPLGGGQAYRYGERRFG